MSSGLSSFYIIVEDIVLYITISLAAQRAFYLATHLVSRGVFADIIDLLLASRISAENSSAPTSTKTDAHYKTLTGIL